jgi:phosphatidate cytidylyltransferase
MRTRVMTAVALLFLVAAVLFTGSETVWVTFLAVLLALAADEWTTLSGFRGLWWRALTVVLTLGVAASRYLGGMTAGLPFALVIFVPLWILGAGWMLSRPLQEIRGMALAERWLSLLLGMVCLLALAEALLQLYRIDIAVLLASMAVVWVSDSAAYFAGRRFGKRKLAPVTSPGKSWEGVWAALLAVALMGMIWVMIAPTQLPALVIASSFPSLAMVALCVLAAMAGISGDLVESRLKRVAGVKDSGRCLPGHGGVLDRIDALIPAMPVMAVAYAWVVQ